MLHCHTVPDLDSLDAVDERLFQNAFANGPEHQAEQPPLEVLAFAHNDDINIGCAISMTHEGVGVAGRASPYVRVSRRESDVFGVGPVVVQAFPDAAGAFGDVSLRAAQLMHLEIFVGAVVEELRAARPEVG